MKWLLLIAALALVPLLANWMRHNPNAVPSIWIVIGLLIAASPLKVHMAVLSWAGMWPGYVSGLEISLIDIVLLAVFLTLPSRRQWTPFVGVFGLYLATVLLSAFHAISPLAGMFYAWQLCRIFFVSVIITRACAADDRVPVALLKGMALGLLVVAVQAAWQRFALGIVQTTGSFGHQNFLGLMSHFVVFPFFALLLANARSRLPWLVSSAGIVVAILTASRATVAAATLGLISLFALSAVRQWTPQKMRVAVVGTATLFVIVPLFLSSFGSRFGEDLTGAFLGTDSERVKLEKVASMMVEDHPLVGVGPNHYVIAANQNGYNTRAELNWTSFSAHVHNVYWLVAAETGYLGLAALVLMLLRPVTLALSCGWRHRRDIRGDLLLGLGVSLLIVYLHSFYEWVFISFQAQYCFAAVTGLIAGLAQQLGYSSSRAGKRSLGMPNQDLQTRESRAR